MKKMWLVTVLLVGGTFSGLAQASAAWDEFVTQVKADAKARGVSNGTLNRAMATVREPNRKVISQIRSQPEKKETFLRYRARRADAARIRIGKQKYRKHRALLQQIEQRYGVDACVVTAIWGLETAYGGYMGNFPVIQSLATLAFDSHRKDFFRGQLLQALQILDEGHITLDRYRGEWAGASGHPQFLPSSWLNYAVDFNGDGRKDVWSSIPDALASIANYLAKNGWKTGQPWGIEAQLPAGFDQGLIEGRSEKPVSAWQAMGIQLLENVPHDPSAMATIVNPHGGPAFVAFPNFRTIMTYNRSTYYAGTIGWTADKICGRK
jgi:membrane-bound lytic murein transglycosylase B